VFVGVSVVIVAVESDRLVSTLLEIVEAIIWI
jgi:hypothetical protein